MKMKCMMVMVASIVALLCIGGAIAFFSADDSNAAVVGTTTENGLSYELYDDNTAKLTGVASLSGAIVVPATVTYNETVYSITSTEKFQSNKNITSIEFQSERIQTMTSMFQACTKLTSVKINPDQGAVQMFQGCSALVSVEFGGTPTTIGQNCFYNLTKLKTVTLPNTITNIDNSAFYGCTVLTNLSLPNVVTVGNSVFYNCKAFTQLPFSSLTSFGSDVFRGCIGLTSVTFDFNGAAGGSGMFNGCTGLTSATITGMNTVPQTIFNGCTKLTTANLGSSITSVGQAAFNGCTLLSNLTIEGNVTMIAGQAFANCAALTDTGIDYDSVSEITSGAFAGSGLTDMIIGNGQIYYVPASMANSPIPEGVTAIGASAYTGLAVTSITIPASITAIGDNAFKNCTSLTTVTFESGSRIESIGANAFSGCTALTSFTCDSTVLTLGASAFEKCAALTAFAPSVIKEAGSKAFLGTHIGSMIIAEKDGVRTLCWTGNAENAVVPDGVSVIGSYCASPEMTSIALPNSIRTISTYAFSESRLTSIVLPEGVEVVDARAFNKCAALSSITLPESLTYIPQYCFFECTALTGITLPSHIDTINNYAFNKCTALTSITIPASVKTMGNSIFASDTALTTVVFEGSPTTLGTYIFNGCSALSSVTLQPGLRTIGQQMFYNCSSLKSVVIPDSVTEIKTNAFSGSGLTSVDIPAGVADYGASLFKGCTGLESVIFRAEYVKLLNNAFTDCTSLRSIELYGSLYVSSSSFTNVASIEEIILHTAAPISDTYFVNAVSSDIKTVADGITCIAVKMSDGSGLIDGKMLMASENGTLVIPADVTAVNLSAVKEALGSADSVIGVEDGNTVFSFTDGMLMAGNHLVFIKDCIVSGNVPEGIEVIDPAAVSSASQMVSLKLPSTLTRISAAAFAGSTLGKIFFQSAPAISANSGIPGTADCYRSAAVTGAIDNAAVRGIYLETANGTVFIETDDWHVSARIITEGSAAVFWLEPLAGYTDSVISVSRAGTPLTALPGDSTVTVAGSPAADGYLLENISGDIVLSATGIRVNQYTVTFPDSDGFAVSTSALKASHGQEFLFSVEIRPGYEAGPEFRISVGGVSVEPVSAVGKIYTFSIAVTGPSEVSVTGIRMNATHTVTFSTDGAAVAPQTVPDGACAAMCVPVRTGFIFGGWYVSSDLRVLYDFAEPVRADRTVYAKWYSQDTPSAAVNFGGTAVRITAVADGWKTVSSGDLLPIGSTVIFKGAAESGYEIGSWSCNGDVSVTNSDTFQAIVQGETNVTADGLWTVGVPYYNHYSVMAPLPGHFKTVWTTGNGNTSGMSFTNMTYLPSVLGDYSYSKNDNVLLKIDLKTGATVKSVQTAPSFSGFYEYVAVGNGVILDCVSGKVFNQDLEQLFSIGVKSQRAFYNDGCFYICDGMYTYCYAAADEDPSAPDNMQNPVWKSAIGQAIAQYEGTVSMYFADSYLYTISAGSSGERYMLTASIADGHLIDRIAIPEFEGRSINSGYMDFNQGYASMSVYGAGIFDAGGGNIYNVAICKVTDDGYFDRATLKVISSGTGDSYCSGPMIEGDRVYLYAGGRFQVYDLDTMALLAQTESLSAKIGAMHGSMAINRFYDGKVYGYVIPYNSCLSIFGFEYDIASNTISPFEMENIATKAQYASGQVRFTADGNMLWVNDSGTLFCARYSEDFSFSGVNGPENIGVGCTRQLTPLFMQGAILTDLVWTSSNPDVATVDEHGLVTVVGLGEAVIRAENAKGDFAEYRVVGMPAYSFLLIDSTGEDESINGWYTAGGTDALDALINALNAANIRYSFEYSENGIWFSSAATISNWTVGAWESNGDVYNPNYSIWNWNAADGWHQGNTFGTDDDRVYIISHEKYVDVAGSTAARYGVVGGSDVSALIPGVDGSCARYGYLMLAPQNMNVSDYRDTVFGPTEYTVTFVADGRTVSTVKGYQSETVVAPAAPTKATDRTNMYTFVSWNGYTEGMRFSADAEFTAVFRTDARAIQTYNFWLLDSTGENTSVNGWYTADGTDALDALMNALDAAHISHTLTYSTAGIWFSSAATISGWTVGAWESDGEVYNPNYSIWNWNADDGWFLGNTFGTDPDTVYIISHERYVDSYWNGTLSQKIGFKAPYTVIPGATAEHFAYDGTTGGYANVEKAVLAAYGASGYGMVDVDLSLYGLVCTDEDYEGMELLMWFMDCVDTGSMDASALIPGYTAASASYGYLQLAPQNTAVSDFRDTVFGPTLYTVSFYADGKKVYESQGYLNNAIAAPADPSKATDGLYDYTFASWDGYTAGDLFSDNASFTAVFDRVLSKTGSDVPAVLQSDDGGKTVLTREEAKHIADSGKTAIVKSEAADVSLPSSVMSDLMQKNDASVSLWIAKVDVSALSDDARKIVGNRTVISIDLLAGDIRVHELGGMATVTVPYVLGAGESADRVVVYYLNDSNELEAMETSYDRETGTVSFVTDHFSMYVIGISEETKEYNGWILVGIIAAIILGSAVLSYLVRPNKH